MQPDWKWRSHWDEFSAKTSWQLHTLETVIRDTFGDRCDTYEPNCETCRRWAAFDTLFENPFDEPK